jgi:hypothetical protein
MTETTTVVFDNVSGSEPANIVVAESPVDLHPGAFGIQGVGTSVTFATNLNDGEFFMTLSIPFNAADIGALDPLTLDLAVFDPVTTANVLAVSLNTINSPGFATPVGDRTAVAGTVEPALSADIGDYGVFWNPTTLQGFVWANIDHASDFIAGAPAPPIPAASTWGLFIIGLTLLSAGTVVFRSGRSNAPARG